METFSALLAICAGNSPVPVNSPHKGQWRGALMFSLICAWINGWVNYQEAGDLRRNRTHYDVIVMSPPPLFFLMSNCGGSSAGTLELLQCSAEPSRWAHNLDNTFIVMVILMHCSCYGLALGHRLEHTSWSICLLSWSNVHIDGLARECGGSGASTLELLHSCAGSSAWAYIRWSVQILPWSYWWRDVELW